MPFVCQRKRAVTGVGAIQAVGWMNKEGINNFYINCTVKDK
jgi:hypothetical protein